MTTTILLSISEMALSLLQLLIFYSILCKSLFIFISNYPFFCLLALSNSQGQFYEVKPYDISALIGSNITIPCVIAPPHGDVQWTKDGLALGKIFFSNKYIYIYLCTQTLNIIV
jgi:hypothetical protein